MVVFLYEMVYNNKANNFKGILKGTTYEKN